MYAPEPSKNQPASTGSRHILLLRRCALHSDYDPHRRCMRAFLRHRLSEWTESKESGWEGDAPPVAGLSLGEEITGLLEQVSHVRVLEWLGQNRLRGGSSRDTKRTQVEQSGKVVLSARPREKTPHISVDVFQAAPTLQILLQRRPRTNLVLPENRHSCQSAGC